tara:strand:- start:42 stop:368 length:327 start_codon:yes stop_codon:yes gene_type:complete
MKKLLALLLLFGIVGCAGDIEMLNNDLNPSAQQRAAEVRGFNDYKLCFYYFDNQFGGWRSKEYRYKLYVPVVDEVDKRNLDCSQFPEFSKKEEWKRQWIKDYESALNK